MNPPAYGMCSTDSWTSPEHEHSGKADRLGLRRRSFGRREKRRGAANEQFQLSRVVRPSVSGAWQAIEWRLRRKPKVAAAHSGGCSGGGGCGGGGGGGGGGCCCCALSIDGAMAKLPGAVHPCRNRSAIWDGAGPAGGICVGSYMDCCMKEPHAISSGRSVCRWCCGGAAIGGYCGALPPLAQAIGGCCGASMCAVGGGGCGGSAAAACCSCCARLVAV